MIRVLFICLGNICRSPMAEAVFRHKVKEAGLEKSIEVDSAGTANWHTGKIPHEGTRGKLDELGVSYEDMFARQVKENDFRDYEYILAMDANNIQDLESSFTFAREGMYFGKLMDLIENPKEENVPDPYYTGDFNYTYELINEACDVLLKKIIHEHKING